MTITPHPKYPNAHPVTKLAAVAGSLVIVGIAGGLYLTIKTFVRLYNHKEMK